MIDISEETLGSRAKIVGELLKRQFNLNESLSSDLFSFQRWKLHHTGVYG